MTFSEIQSRVASRLNLSSTDALTRLGNYINDRYVRVTSSIGLQTARRVTATTNTAAGDPRVAFTLEKIEVVYCIATGKRRVLSEVSYDEWRRMTVDTPQSGDPVCYAIEESGASTVTIVCWPEPSAVVAMKADGLENASTLSGSNVPAFPADFHDALVFGAMADEYSKLEKPKLADKFEMQFEQRVADLRFFLAKSIYAKNHQGRTVTGPRRPRDGGWME